jgi:hypothetical protein
VEENPDSLSVEDYYDGYPGINYYSQSENQFSTTSVDGFTAYKFEPSVTLDGDVVVVIPRPGSFLVIEDRGAAFQENGVFDSILSALKIQGGSQ